MTEPTTGTIVRSTQADTVRIERPCLDCAGTGCIRCGESQDRHPFCRFCTPCNGSGTLAVDVPAEVILAVERVLRECAKGRPELELYSYDGEWCASLNPKEGVGNTPQAALIELAKALEGGK